MYRKKVCVICETFEESKTVIEEMCKVTGEVFNQTIFAIPQDEEVGIAIDCEEWEWEKPSYFKQYGYEMLQFSDIEWESLQI